MREIIDMICDEGTRSQVVLGKVEEDFTGLIPADSPRTIIITDAKVHASNLSFINSFEHIVIGQGESSKTFVKLEEVYRQLLNMGADRSTFIVGMGGGIVTDVTGFVASTYMRGVRFAFLPTTLLAQVDASIGGKNGVNLDGYKNIIGVFNQPEFVLCDPGLLGSLPDREFRAGLAEIIKAAVIGDPELFALMENRSFEELRSDTELLTQVILRSVKVKTAIVAHDQREHGERRKLNLGHTFAHAIEKSFTTFSHGEAVAAGIAIVCSAAVRSGRLDAAAGHRIKAVIEKAGLPTEFPVEIKKLLIAIRADKKREGKNIYLVFPASVGHCTVEKVNTEDLESIFIDPDAAKPATKPVSAEETVPAEEAATVVQTEAV